MLMIYIFIILLFILGMFNLKSSYMTYNKSKFETYECSYSEMSNYNTMYSSQFFILALSFMLFDLEIVFFLPYFISFYYSYNITYILMFFLIFLLFSLYYELLQKIV